MKSKYPLLSINTPRGITRDDVMLTLPLGLTAPYLQSRVFRESNPDEQPGVRVYRSSPESMTLQIWTYGATGEFRKGKPRVVFSQFSSNRQNMLRLAKEIERIALKLPEA